MPKGTPTEFHREEIERVGYYASGGNNRQLTPLNFIGSFPEGEGKKAAIKSALGDTDKFLSKSGEVAKDPSLHGIAHGILHLRREVLGKMLAASSRGEIKSTPYKVGTSGDKVHGGPFAMHEFYIDLYEGGSQADPSHSIIAGVETRITNACRTDFRCHEIGLAGDNWMMRSAIGSDPLLRRKSRPTRAGFFARGEGDHTLVASIWRKQAGKDAPIEVPSSGGGDLMIVGPEHARRTFAEEYADLGIEEAYAGHSSAADKWQFSVENGFWYREKLIVPVLSPIETHGRNKLTGRDRMTSGDVKKPNIVEMLGNIRELISAINASSAT